MLNNFAAWTAIDRLNCPFRGTVLLVGDGSFLRRLARARLVLRGDRLGSWYLDTYPVRASQPARAGGGEGGEGWQGVCEAWGAWEEVLVLHP